MALLVSDNRHEEFSKPPPKKKWLQEYIEQDSQPNMISSNLRNLLRTSDNQTDEKLNSNLQQLGDTKRDQGNITLSKDVIGGVVQGVLDQFQSFFENECSSGASASFENKAFSTVSSELKVRKLSKLLDPARNGAKFNESLKRLSWPGSLDDKANPTDIPEVKQDLKISQNDIAPVVQSVISQFLNGSLADSEFRRSRKRSHKHANCHHRDKSGSSGPSDRIKRSSSVIQFKSKTPEIESPIKINKLEPQPIEGSVIVPHLKVESAMEIDENQALNLSLPKHNQKVTFATHDRCYSTESVKSFQTSKSEDMTNLDILARASDDRTKMNIAADIKPNVSSHLMSQADNLRIAGKSVSPVNASSHKDEHRYYERPQSYIELTPVIRHTHREESPMNMALPVRKEEHTFRPIVKHDSYGSHSPPLLEVLRCSQFSSLPSSRQTSPVCLKKSVFPYSGQPSHSPPLKSLLYSPPHLDLVSSAPSHRPIFSTSPPNSYVSSSPIAITRPHSSTQAHHFSLSPPCQSPISHSPSQLPHKSISPTTSVLTKGDPVNLSCDKINGPSMYSFPVIKPKPMKPFLESTDSQSKPIFTNAYHSKPQSHGSYAPTDTLNSNNKTSLNISPSSNPIRTSREKADTNTKEEIKRTSSTTREVHNRLEKNRRAHLKTCFDELAVECDLDPKKASNLTVIRSAYKYIMSLRRKERENERNLATLVQEKIKRQNMLEELKREFPGYKSESDCE
eukprot:GFUD01018739.1.p1 GENE.GFUD01018739.1~~GFUD01018739.1.p1  ORF type:complete len:736 (-),score=153.86 GFUD01018739.1:122-2329(-)